MKITNHYELRNTKCGIDCSSPQITDQSDAQACDINNIMKNYQKTGMLSHVSQKIAKFQDNTGLPSLEIAFKTVNEAMDAFSELPADIRKLMDNDPSKLEEFIQDKENTEILIKKGILTKKEVIHDAEKTDISVKEVKNV